MALQEKPVRLQNPDLNRKSYEDLFLIVAIFLMLIASVWRMTNEFQRLLFDESISGAVDLRFRHDEVDQWFKGEPVYDSTHAIYPPATYVLLWPFLGWLSFEAARWFWAVSSICMMIWLALILIYNTDAETTKERCFLAVLVPSVYATGAAIGNGQLIVHLLPALIFSLLRLKQPDKNRKDHFLIAASFLFVMIKPAIALPFLCLILVMPGGWKATLFIMTGYLALTIIAVLFQSQDVIISFQQWLDRGSAAATRGGYANIHSWLVASGMESWMLPSSLIILTIFASWSYLNRRSELWLVLGVGGYVSRLWMYHRLYDDLLILLPLIALGRIYKKRRSAVAATLFVLTWAAALAPARFLSYAPPWNILFEWVQSLIWLSGLFYLVYEVSLHKRELSDVTFDAGKTVAVAE